MRIFKTQMVHYAFLSLTTSASFTPQRHSWQPARFPCPKYCSRPVSDCTSLLHWHNMYLSKMDAFFIPHENGFHSMIVSYIGLTWVGPHPTEWRLDCRNKQLRYRIPKQASSLSSIMRRRRFCTWRYMNTTLTIIRIYKVVIVVQGAGERSKLYV